MAIASVEALTAARLGEATVTIENIGDLIIRSLTRGQALALNDVESLEDKDNLMISMGVVNPKLSIEQVQAWAENAPAGELGPVSEAIARLSGMTRDSGKDATKSVPRRRK